MQVAKAEQPVVKNLEIGLVLRGQSLIGVVELAVQQAGKGDLHQGKDEAGDEEAPVKTEQGTARSQDSHAGLKAAVNIAQVADSQQVPFLKQLVLRLGWIVCLAIIEYMQGKLLPDLLQVALDQLFQGQVAIVGEQGTEDQAGQLQGQHLGKKHGLPVSKALNSKVKA